MADIGDVKVKFIGDATGLITAVNTSRTAVQNFTTTAETATGPIGRVATGFERFERREPYLAVRNLITAFDTMAATSIGLEGPIGRVASGLLMLGTGGVVGVAVTAGLAAIAVAMKLMGDSSDFAATSVKKVHEQVKKLAETLPETKMADRKAEYADVAKQLKALEEKLHDAHMRVLLLSNAFGPHAAQTEKAAAAYNALRAEVTKAKAALETLAEPGTMAPIEVMAELARQASSSFTSAANVLGRGNRPFGGGEELPAQSIMIGGANLPGRSPLGQAMDKAATEAETRFKQRMRDAGMNAIRSLIDGIFQGTVNFGDILKNLIEEFVLAKIVGPLNKLLGIHSPSTVGMHMGAMIAQGIGMGMQTANLGPLALNLNVNTGSMPAPLTPFEASRDRNWQALLRESQLVGQSQGFRLRGQ